MSATLRIAHCHHGWHLSEDLDNSGTRVGLMGTGEIAGAAPPSCYSRRTDKPDRDEI